jgi:hypothetical protein
MNLQGLKPILRLRPAAKASAPDPPPNLKDAAMNIQPL